MSIKKKSSEIAEVTVGIVAVIFFAVLSLLAAVAPILAVGAVVWFILDQMGYIK